MAKTAHDIVESQRFKALVRKRWSVSIVLTILLFVLYYGCILVVAYAKPLLAVKVGTYTTLGIVLPVISSAPGDSSAVGESGAERISIRRRSTK